MIFYLLAFVITIAVEFSVIYFLLRESWKSTLLYIFLINSFTWPPAYLAFNLFGANFLAVELAVILVESVFIKELFDKEYFSALGISLLANGVTAALSFL